MDSGFARFMNKAVDVFILNILWVVFSIPVVTIGAATCAAFSVTLKMVDDEEGYVAKMFIKAFKSNFKQSTIMWCITAPCIYLCYLIWQFIIKGDDVHFVIIIGAILFTAVAICVNLYTYAIIARYDNTLKKSILNSVVICMLYFWRTLMIVALVALELLLIFWNRWTMLAGILIGPEFIIYTISGVSKRIFQTIEKNGGVIVPPVSSSDEPSDDVTDESDENDEEVDDETEEPVTDADESQNEESDENNEEKSE